MTNEPAPDPYVDVPLFGDDRLAPADLDAMPEGSLVDDTSWFEYTWMKDADGNWRIEAEGFRDPVRQHPDARDWPAGEPGLTAEQLDHLYGPVYNPPPVQP